MGTIRSRARDYVLLASTLARPATTVFGDDAYPSLADAAGSLHRHTVED